MQAASVKGWRDISSMFSDKLHYQTQL